MSSTSGTFAPPGFQDFTFTCAKQLVLAQPTQLVCQRVLKGKTRESGEHKVLIQFKGYPDPPCPVSLAALIEIVDINRKSITTTTQLILHPCLYYVGLRKQAPNPVLGEPFVIDIVVADHDGNVVDMVDVTVQLCALERWSGRKQILKLEVIKSEKEPIPYTISPEALSTGALVRFPFPSFIINTHTHTHTQTLVSLAADWAFVWEDVRALRDHPGPGRS